MKKIFKIWALVAVLVLSLCPTFAIATSTATTLEDIFIGEYDSGDLSGFAHIVFGTISDMDAEYGIVLTDVEEGKSYAFKGKSIGDDGKFGIAVYDMPMGKEFKAKVLGENAREITLKMDALTDAEKQIILKGCLINYYKG